MDQDNFTDVFPSDDQSPRRSFGGLGRGPAALSAGSGPADRRWHQRVRRGEQRLLANLDLRVDHARNLAFVPAHGRIHSELTLRSPRG